jgi:hypothetical protein
MLAQRYVDQRTIAVDGRIQVAPLAMDLAITSLGYCVPAAPSQPSTCNQHIASANSPPRRRLR